MPSERPRLHPIAAVLCDDIRREDNGKSILIGTYSEGVGASQFPIELSLAMYLIFTVSGVGNAAVQFEFRSAKNELLGSVTTGLEIMGTTPPHLLHSFGLPGVPMRFTEAGMVSIAYRQEEDDWKTLQVFPVVLQEAKPSAKASSEPLQPS
jgi:hypothetical protein